MYITLQIQQTYNLKFHTWYVVSKSILNHFTLKLHTQLKN